MYVNMHSICFQYVSTKHIKVLHQCLFMTYVVHIRNAYPERIQCISTKSRVHWVGDASKTVTDLPNIESIQQVYHVNVISPSFLISRFCNHFINVNKFVIHTSTLAAIQPFPLYRLYSSSKAGMDMYIRNLASDCLDVRALNYAPGPMDTEMGREMMDETGSKDSKDYFNMMVNE